MINGLLYVFYTTKEERRDQLFREAINFSSLFYICVLIDRFSSASVISGTADGAGGFMFFYKAILSFATSSLGSYEHNLVSYKPVVL